ncbi:MAG: nitroreductase family protein [Desulfuromonadales bacterium]|nr:nitroreductase family protein [Desulfuromonadales bacterium]
MSKRPVVLETLRKRRSIRQFEARPVEAEKVDLLIEAALRSPTSRGRSPWEFIVVTEPELLGKLGQSKQHGSAFLAGAPLAIVVLADPETSDVWTEDCSIAAIVLQLAAEELGLGSCWVQIRQRPHNAEQSAEAFIRDALQIPASIKVECVIGIGYPNEEKAGHADETLLYDKIHRERYRAE